MQVIGYASCAVSHLEESCLKFVFLCLSLASVGAEESKGVFIMAM